MLNIIYLTIKGECQGKGNNISPQLAPTLAALVPTHQRLCYVLACDAWHRVDNIVYNNNENDDLLLL